MLEPGRPTAADVVAGDGTEVLLLTPEDYLELQQDHIEFRRLLVSTMPSYATYNFFFQQQLFREAPHEFLQQLLQLVTLEDHNAGATLQHVTKNGGGLWFVQKGHLTAQADSLKPIELDVGACFGLEVLLGKRAKWTVTAQTDVQLWRLPIESCQVGAC